MSLAYFQSSQSRRLSLWGILVPISLAAASSVFAGFELPSQRAGDIRCVAGVNASTMTERAVYIKMDAGHGKSIPSWQTYVTTLADGSVISKADDSYGKVRYYKNGEYLCELPKSQEFVAVLDTGVVISREADSYGYIRYYKDGKYLCELPKSQEFVDVVLNVGTVVSREADSYGYIRYYKDAKYFCELPKSQEFVKVTENGDVISRASDGYGSVVYYKNGKAMS